jgi:glycosyltransferase involved in cell wall biosynthesis
MSYIKSTNDCGGDLGHKVGHGMIHISVVIPFYNAERHIEQCIESILSQSYPREHYEIIMVDNNSTDKSAAIVRRYYPRVKLISEDKQGAYSARNKGLGEAKGEIIAFTDPDCAPSRDWLQEIATAMDSSNVDIVIGRHEFFRDGFVLSMLEAYENEKNKYVFNSKIEELYYGHNNNMAVRKKLFNQIGPFVERSRGSDTIFVRQCVERYSYNVIGYYQKIRVRHMEIDCLHNYLRKVYIHSASRRKYRHIAYVKSLTNWDRFLVFLRTIKSQRYSLAKSAFLFGLLSIGLMYWNLGSIIAAWSSERESAS